MFNNQENKHKNENNNDYKVRTKEDINLNKNIEIQNIIIHQLHNQLDHNNYINKELKLKKHTLSYPRVFKSALIILIVLILSIIFLNNFQKSYNIIFCATLIDIGVVSIIIIISVIKEFSIRDIKLKDFNIKQNNKIQDNQYITKETQLIIELLKEISKKEKKKRLIVFIEDIDRNNNLDIFMTIYHISMILKVSKIKFSFIYAAKPSLFDTFSTKYFDAIIDIIPFYDRLTSSDVLYGEIIEYDKNIKIDKKFINNIAHYIVDYRDLTRVVNMFKNYKEKFPLLIDNEKLVSIVIIKTLYPKYLNLKSLNEDQDIIEKLLEEISRVSKNSKIKFKDVIKEKYDESDKENENKEIKKIIKKIKEEDKKLWKILKIIIELGKLDDNYHWIISTANTNYTINDQKFITNYIDNNGMFEKPDKYQIDDINKISEEFLYKNDYKYKKELINISLVRHFMNKIKTKDNETDNIIIFNNLITNIINNNKLNDLFGMSTKKWTK